MQDCHPLARMLRQLLNRSNLGEEDQAAILALPHQVKDLPLSSYIVREGDRPTHSCTLISGFAVRHKIVAFGGRQITNLHIPGDMLDLQNSLLRFSDHNVQTLSKVEVAFIPREEIERLAFERPAVGKALWIDSLAEASITREWVANVGRRDAKTRIAHLLCEFAMRLEAIGLAQKCNYELPMTQDQIGDTVGLTAVHVNRTLKVLDAEGYTQRSKRAVVIKDWKRLAEVGDFNPLYLHLNEREGVF